MSLQSAGLALHFLLELGALAAIALWGFQAGGSRATRLLLGIGAPLLGAIAWATFRVPGDPGDAPVAIPGVLRLTLELGLFGLAVAALASTGRGVVAAVFVAAVVLDYAIAYERVLSLLGER